MVVSVAMETRYFSEKTLPLYEAIDLTKGGDLAKI